jgi:nicotinamide-nucleotide amidase
MPEPVTAEDLDYVEIDRALIERAIEALDAARRRGLKVVTAESCTGGLVATALSEAPGAAEHFDGAFICYTAEHKCTALGLRRDLIDRFGAVSEEVARAMAEAALKCSTADVAVAVTGVAGPDKDENGNPVGLVFLACARRGGETACLKRNFGEVGRSRVRYQAASEALALLAGAACN